MKQDRIIKLKLEAARAKKETKDRLEQLHRAHREQTRLNEIIREKNKELAWREADIREQARTADDVLSLLKAVVVRSGWRITVSREDFDAMEAYELRLSFDDAPGKIALMVTPKQRETQTDTENGQDKNG